MTIWIRASSALMFLAVAMGAFGAHALKGRLIPEMQGIYETGVRYQIYHALALFVIAWLGTRSSSPWVSRAGLCFFFGTVLFSGSLYALSLSGVRKFGAVTPIGGLLFLAGWLILLFLPLT